MSLIWKINGVPLPATGLRRLRLTYENQQADTCSFEDPLAAFDASLRFAFDSDVVVASNDGSGDICRFRGRIAETPRYLGAKAESIRYLAKGRWQDLARRPFVQNFQIATTPGNPASALGNLPVGLVILNQGDNGASAYLSASLAYVINSAIAAGAALTLGTIANLDFFVPWDETADLNCADAIHRLLQLTPDVVVSWDYTTTNPTINLNRRGQLPALSLPVAPAGAAGLATAYAPLESITLTPLWHLLASGVCIIYVQTDRVDATRWLLVEQEVYPPGTTANQADGITRTVKLTGSVTANTYLTQDVETSALPTALTTDAAHVVGLVTAATDAAAGPPPTGYFGQLSAFWLRHCPHLLAAGITILGFRNTYRTPEGAGDTGAPGTSAAPNTACVRELTAGSVTDWMINDQDIAVETENVHSEVAYTIITDVNSGAVEKKIELLSKRIIATNASTGTYSEQTNSSYTPPETVPAGLAENIYAGVSALHYDGTLDLVGIDPPLPAGIGCTLNLTGSRPEWATMAALVQRVSLDVDEGRTRFRVGWPRQLMPADLMQLWRANKTRQPVEVAAARATGLSGNGTGDSAQSMGKYHHAPVAGVGAHNLPSIFTALVSLAGATLASTDLQAALHNAANPVYGLLRPLASALSTDRFPKTGDRVRFYLAGQDVFKEGTVTANDIRPNGVDTVWNFQFAANDQNWYMHCVKVGPYTPPSSDG